MISRIALVDQVIDAIQRDIAGGRLPRGGRLPPEPELMRRLGVGRSTLREAVRVLAHGGVLEVRQGDGTYVRGVGLAEPLARRLRRAGLRDVNEVRRMIEIEAARLAAERRTTYHVDGMREALDRRLAAYRAGDVEPMIDADLDFHQIVVGAAGNAVLRDLFASFSDVLRDALRRTVNDPDLGRDATAQHERVFEAIAGRRPEEAAAATADLLAGIEEMLRE
jgi:GntR family transcriptional regulator, transcriptional repressor for pyruvate dehydrogenase complex